MEPVDDTSHGRDLVIAGAINGGSCVDADLLVAMERVVPDDADPDIIDLVCAPIHTDADGRFTYRYSPQSTVRGRLHGWVMCMVVVQPRVMGSDPYCKVVRWQRPSSDDLLTGLGALLGPLLCELAVVS
jgi:hypothetical protein